MGVRRGEALGTNGLQSLRRRHRRRQRGRPADHGRSRAARSRRGVLSDIGSFGGLFHLGARRRGDPVLVASADGVGTKLRVAFMAGIAPHDRRRSRQPLRQRHPGAGRRAAVLPRLPRHRPPRSGRGRADRRGARRRLPRRTAARCSAARRRRCPASTRTASTTSPASSSAPCRARD